MIRAKLPAALLFLTLFASTATGQVIKLQNGPMLVGEVQDATSDGLTFRRLDNGGVLSLEWGDLSPSSATEIRRLKGLLVEDDLEPTVIADVLEYVVAGGIRQELVGRIVGETPEVFTMRRKGADIPVRRASIKNRKKREVPILEVYTRDSYYAEQLAAADPGKDADKHIKFADQLRVAGDFAGSEKHLVIAEELGGGKQSSQLPAMLARVRLLRESSAERGLLSKISQMRNRKNFTAAAEFIAEFEEKYPDSKLANEFEREKVRYERARERSFIDDMRTMWPNVIRTVVNNKINTTPKLTLSGAREWAEAKMAEEMFEHCGRSLGIEADEAQGLWENRNKYTRARSTVFSYGVGSWVLGYEAIIKDTKVEKGQQEQADGNSSDPELQRIRRMIREHRKRARQVARERAGQGDDNDEAWWKRLKLADKRHWLRCYFAEFGGQMEVTAAHAHACVNCNAEGTTTSLGSAGRPIKTKCPVCRGTKYTRLIRAR